LPRSAAQILDRQLSDLEADQLRKYLHLLIKWQRSQRLIGSSEPGWIIDHIILDSLLFTRLLPSSAARIIDIGSGAGVPGIPLSIVLEPRSFTLLEARAKRVSFLSAVVRELELRNCAVKAGRLESMAADQGSSFDAAVLRCTGNPVEVQVEAFQLLKPGGLMIASGPPARRTTAIGEWTEVEGPIGRRLFWTAVKLDG
jgi:16S rRNA (guanine527-N7)-methyltransferase